MLEITGPWADRGCTLLELAGDLDANAAPALREHLTHIAARPLRLIIVMDHVPWIDETGLGVLLGAAKRAHDSGGGIALTGCTGRARQRVDTGALARVLHPCASIEDAIALLTGREPNGTPTQHTVAR